MRVPRIYTRQSLGAGRTVELETGASRHIARVLRMQAGTELVLFDGHGGEYPATITALDRGGITASCGARREREVESPLAVHLGIAVSRGERMDWVIQKATELGVCEISPLQSARTEVKLSGERAEKKLRHWRQIAISACEQCGRNRLPRLNAPRDLDYWLEAAGEQRRYVLHHRAASRVEPLATPTSIALLIGPEGGLTEDEIALAERAGFTALRLGPRILRTETAPLAALAILQARWGDMSF